MEETALLNVHCSLVLSSGLCLSYGFALIKNYLGAFEIYNEDEVCMLKAKVFLYFYTIS